MAWWVDRSISCQSLWGFVPDADDEIIDARSLIDLAASALAFLPALAGVYLAALAVLARPGRPVEGKRRMRIAVLVPSHNEEGNIAATVQNLLAVPYPEALREVVVLADNCTDRTAEIARSAGATVIERCNDQLRGKGHALTECIPKVLADETIEVLSVVDADTVVTDNFFDAISAHMSSGQPCLQLRYTISNPEASWRTRLLRIALSAFHDVRSLARERLHLSCGLRGNGMAFSRELLACVPHHTETIIEDLEFGIRLANHGVRVAYVHEASVLGEMAADSSGSAVQHNRWEGGRVLLKRMYAWRLLRTAVARRDRVRADLAFDLLVPPLGQLVFRLGSGLAIALMVSRLAEQAMWAPKMLAVGLAGCAIYVLRGWQYSGTGLRGLADIAFAPVYVAWKLTNRAASLRRLPTTWVRTPRQHES